MTIAKMLELAQTLPYETDHESEPDINDIISAVLFPVSTDQWTFDIDVIVERLKFKLLHSQTTDNFKYGSQLRLIHLDDIPMVLVEGHGRWLSTIGVYSFDAEKLNQLQQFFYHNGKNCCDFAPTILTDEMLSNTTSWWGGKLTNPDGYPYRNDT